MGDNINIAPVVENAPRQQIIGASIYCSPKFCRYKSWIITLTLKYPLMILHWRLKTYAFWCARFKRVDCQNIPDAKLCVHIYLRIWFALKLWIQIIQYLPIFRALTSKWTCPTENPSLWWEVNFHYDLHMRWLWIGPKDRNSARCWSISPFMLSVMDICTLRSVASEMRPTSHSIRRIANQVPMQIKACCSLEMSFTTRF